MTEPIELLGFMAILSGQVIQLQVAKLCSRTITHSLCNGPRFFQELRNECIVDTRLHKQAGSRNTCLSRSDKGGKSRPVYGRRNVGIVENYDWGLVHHQSVGLGLQLFLRITFPPSSAVKAARFSPTMLPRARPVSVPALTSIQGRVR